MSAKKSGGKKWTPEEEQRLRGMMANGWTTKAAAVELDRTHKSVATHWTEMNYSVQRMARKREHDNLKRREAKSVGVDQTRGISRVPDEVWAEREARLAAPVSLTGAVFGDPPAGFSALGRKRAGVSA